MTLARFHHGESMKCERVSDRGWRCLASSPSPPLFQSPVDCTSWAEAFAQLGRLILPCYQLPAVPATPPPVHEQLRPIDRSGCVDSPVHCSGNIVGFSFYSLREDDEKDSARGITLRQYWLMSKGLCAFIDILPLNLFSTSSAFSWCGALTQTKDGRLVSVSPAALQKLAEHSLPVWGLTFFWKQHHCLMSSWLEFNNNSCINRTGMTKLLLSTESTCYYCCYYGNVICKKIEGLTLMEIGRGRRALWVSKYCTLCVWLHGWPSLPSL